MDEIDVLRQDVLKMFNTRDHKLAAIEERFEKLQSHQINQLAHYTNRMETDIKVFAHSIERNQRGIKEMTEMLQVTKQITMQNEETHLAINYRI